MVGTVTAKANGTQVALQVNGVDALLLDNAGIVSGIKPSSVTPNMLSGGQTGSAPAVAARAWCVFNGTLAGTNAPIAGHNVSSVTRTAAGAYTINFTTPMEDANYGVVLSCTLAANATGNAPSSVASPTASACPIATYNSSSGAAIDPTRVHAAFFR